MIWKKKKIGLAQPQKPTCLKRRISKVWTICHPLMQNEYLYVQDLSVRDRVHLIPILDNPTLCLSQYFPFSKESIALLKDQDYILGLRFAPNRECVLYNPLELKGYSIPGLPPDIQIGLTCSGHSDAEGELLRTAPVCARELVRDAMKFHVATTYSFIRRNRCTWHVRECQLGVSARNLGVKDISSSSPPWTLSSHNIQHKQKSAFFVYGQLQDFERYVTLEDALGTHVTCIDMEQPPEETQLVLIPGSKLQKWLNNGTLRYKSTFSHKIYAN